jgi:predicted DNA binding protein
MTKSANRTPLTSAEFDQFRHATETYREDLVVSLAGVVGLRPAEIARLRLADLRQYRHGERPCYLLTVREDDDGETRTAYVPRDVAHDLQKYANTHGRDPDERVVDVSARRIQMLVSAVSDRTTTDRLQSVSSRNLRRFFASRLLVEDEVHPRIVQAVGGWSSLESLASFFDDPDETEILEACATPDERPRPTTEQQTSSAVDSRAPSTQTDRGFTRRADDLVACLEILGERLADASTQPEVLSAACGALATCFDGVWICDENGDVRESAGGKTVSSGTVRDTLDETVADGEHPVVVVDSPVEHGTSDGNALCVVAIQSSDTTHGYLCVTDRTFDVTSRRVLADVGRRIGRTLIAVERKQLLLADTGVELTMQSTARESVLVDASSSLDCRFELEGVVPMAAGSLLHFVTVSGASVGDVLDFVGDTDQVTDARLIRDYGAEALLEFVVSGTALALTLVEAGGSVRTLTVEDGRARITGVFSGHADVRGIVEQFTATFPDSQLLSKRDVEEPVQTTARVEHVVHEELTEKQRAVLRAAFLSGYFEWPRGSTAEELAASMGISSPTLHNHLRKAQQKVLTAVFADASNQ